MPGLCYDTSSWADSLWAGHLKHSQNARALLTIGDAKRKHFSRLAEDLFSLLYLRNRPLAKPKAPGWAKEIVTQAQDLAEWPTLKQKCVRSGFATGIANEALLETLVPLLKDAPPPPPVGQPGDPGGDTRRKLRQAIREASKAVDEAEAALDGAGEAFGLLGSTGAGQSESLQDLDKIRSLHALLSRDHLLQRIAQLAGRLHRLGTAHKRTRVQSSVGAITGITLGGDLDKVLPSELAGLRGSRLARLQALGKLIDRRALQYHVEGEEPAARGPLVIALDKSSSMGGEEDVWSSAVALTLLQVATQQKRAWHLILYNVAVIHEAHVEPGQADIAAVCKALSIRCSGGTAFNPPLRRAIDVLSCALMKRKGDLIFVTDGYPNDDGGYPTEETLAALQTLRQEDGATIYAIGIGNSANLDSLKSFATECYHLSARPEQDSERIVPLLAQVM